MNTTTHSMDVSWLLNTDSYKTSHFLQFPVGTTGMSAYIESRGGQFDKTVMFGLSAILKHSLRPITTDDVDEAAELFAAHGEPFDRQAFDIIVNEYGGMPPLRILAAREGEVIPTHNVLAVIESTDERVSLFSLGQYLETLILRVWYPITVASLSWHAKKIIYQALQQSSDDPDGQIPFKLHDFGARGVSSHESAMLGGMAHLVNFMGTDTVAALVGARRFYGEKMAGFSIPASEHSTITSWGRDRETDAYANMLKQFGQPGRILACVSDSYDLFNAVENIWGDTLRQQVIDSGATLVVRPDSGDPVTIVGMTAELLALKFGVTLNSKGYKVLNHVRIIQGDGINLTTIQAICDALMAKGFSIDNIAFGMGGALLQGVNRDTQKMAMKCSAAHINGEWIDVYKDPITDSGKRSKRGRQMLYRQADGTFISGIQGRTDLGEEALVTVYENGAFHNVPTFAEIRARAQSALINSL